MTWNTALEAAFLKMCKLSIGTLVPPYPLHVVIYANICNYHVVQISFFFPTHLQWLLLEEKNNNPFQSPEGKLIKKPSQPKVSFHNKQNGIINYQLPC